MSFPRNAAPRRQRGGHSGFKPPQQNRNQVLAAAAIVLFVVLGTVRHYIMAPDPFPHHDDDGSTSARVFGPVGGSSVEGYSFVEQRAYLKKYGTTCQRSFASDVTANLLLDRFDALSPAYATELWKYCVLYIGTGNVYWDISMALPLALPSDILENSNIAVAMDDTENDFLLRQAPLHHSFLSIRQPRSRVALGMIRFLLEAESLHPTALHETLTLFVANDVHKKRASWKLFHADCHEAATAYQQKADESSPPFVIQIQNKHPSEAVAVKQVPGEPCSAEHGAPCCQVWTGKKTAAPPIMSLMHSRLMTSPENDDNPLPFLFAGGLSVRESELGMTVADLPYIATVREYPTHAPPATIHETPNYFDILLRNNCLPHDKDCFKCLKLGYKEGDEGGDCRVCEAKCPCYCSALCQVRPPPKRLAAEWEVTPPRYRADPSRLIPRVIHQTWFEPVTKEKYPNMSRLIESFRQSGWFYEFYDDDRAAQFLSAHFPPQVREAYDAIIPGAFKADLFRYCVLLIRGGLYADMDILLESNLDQAIDGSIGFLTAQDSPGETIGHRSCLWNGLMAAAPGHPFLTQTIQNVVNNVRNRFTSVDYDDMLCPNPVLSVSHTVDTLFTCGPCILGASLNDVLKRHRQTGFEFGEIDLYETEKKRHKNEGSSKRVTIAVEPDDPRLLIPGRSLLLRQNKEDMGSHRFTHAAANLIVAATDMPEYDDRPKSIEHYSKSHVKFGVYGLSKLYTNSDRANEEISFRVKPMGSAAVLASM